MPASRQKQSEFLCFLESMTAFEQLTLCRVFQCGRYNEVQL